MKSKWYLEKQSIGYGSWQGIKQRCRVITTVNYPKYGAKGIKVCNGIHDSFEHFISVVGNRPTPKHSIDRINNDGSYTCGACLDCIANNWPANMRWATDSEQMLNRGKWNSKPKRSSGLIYHTKYSLNKGICKTRYGKYRARIWQNGKWRECGAFFTIEEARLARDNALASLNPS